MKIRQHKEKLVQLCQRNMAEYFARQRVGDISFYGLIVWDVNTIKICNLTSELDANVDKICVRLRYPHMHIS